MGLLPPRRTLSTHFSNRFLKVSSTPVIIPIPTETVTALLSSFVGRSTTEANRHSASVLRTLAEQICAGTEGERSVQHLQPGKGVGSVSAPSCSDVYGTIPQKTELLQHPLM